MTIQTEHLQRCIDTLESALGFLKAADPETIEYEVYRNAAIKGFELCLEIAGKLLKKALKPYFANPSQVDTLVFKDLFRHAHKHKLLTDEEIARWFEYRDNRNNTAHDYGQAFADETLLLMELFLVDVKRLKYQIDHVKA